MNFTLLHRMQLICFSFIYLDIDVMRVYVCFLVFVLGPLEKVSFACWNIFIRFSFLCIFLYDCINDLFYDLYDCLLNILGRTFVRCYTVSVSVSASVSAVSVKTLTRYEIIVAKAQVTLPRSHTIPVEESKFRNLDNFLQFERIPETYRNDSPRKTVDHAKTCDLPFHCAKPHRRYKTKIPRDTISRRTQFHKRIEHTANLKDAPRKTIGGD